MTKPNPKPVTKKARPKIERQKVEPDLVAELHPKDYSSFPFITLIQYRKAPMVCLVDNVRKGNIHAYVLDLCGPAKVDEDIMLNIAQEWHAKSKDKYPLSVEFSRRGFTIMTGRVYRTLDVASVSDVVGPMPAFPMDAVSNPKRRRRKEVQ